MSDKVFVQVKEKLISYKNAGMRKNRKSVKQLVEKYPLEGWQAAFCSHDNVLAEKAAKAFGHGCTVAEDRDIVIGGFVLVHRGQGNLPRRDVGQCLRGAENLVLPKFRLVHRLVSQREVKKLSNNTIYSINGPVVTIKDTKDFSMMEMVYVGENG